MYYPHTVKKNVVNGKTGKKTTETEYGIRNCDARDKFLKSFGKEKFDKLVATDSHYRKYREPDIPEGCRWIWEQFYFIWSNCERDFNGNVIFTFKDINEYERCFHVYFSIAEKKLLFKIKAWVNEAISDLQQ